VPSVIPAVDEEIDQEIEALAEAIEELEDEELVGSVDVDYVGHPQRAADMFGAEGLDGGDGDGGAKALTAENALEAAAACQELFLQSANKAAIQAASADKIMLMMTAVTLLAPVLAEYGFEAQPTGLVAFGQRLKTLAQADEELAAVADALKAELHLPNL